MGLIGISSSFRDRGLHAVLICSSHVCPCMWSSASWLLWELGEIASLERAEQMYKQDLPFF